MKKIFALILTLIISLSLSSFVYADEQSSVDATVISSSYNSSNDRFFFSVIADLSYFGYPNSKAEPFTFGVDRVNYLNSQGNTAYDAYFEGDEIEPGTILTVYWNGMFMESYPMQLGLVDKVIDTGEYTKFEQGEFEEYYLMFYAELPEPSIDNQDADIEDEEEITDVNPSTGITVNPMKSIFLCFGVFSVATIVIYLLTALKSKSE